MVSWFWLIARQSNWQNILVFQGEVAWKRWFRAWCFKCRSFIWSINSQGNYMLSVDCALLLDPNPVCDSNEYWSVLIPGGLYWSNSALLGVSGVSEWLKFAFVLQNNFSSTWVIKGVSWFSQRKKQFVIFFPFQFPPPISLILLQLIWPALFHSSTSI